MPWLSRKPNVAKLARKRDIDGLVEALRYRDYLYDVEGRTIDVGAPIRRAAIIALTELDDPAARQALATALSDSDPDVRVAALRTLREAREPAVVEALIDGVLSWPVPPYGQAQAEAIEALANTGDPAVPERVAIAFVTDDAGGPLEQNSKLLLRRLLDGATADAAPRVVEAMVRALDEGGRQVRDRAEQVLHWVAEDSVEALIDALQYPSARSAAASALGASKDQRAVEPLLETLQDPDPVARRAAVSGLGEIRDPRAAEALFRASGDNDYRVRSEALTALDKLGTVAVMLAVASSMRPSLRPTAEERRRPLDSPRVRAGARVAVHRLMNRGRSAEAPIADAGGIVIPGRAAEERVSPAPQLAATETEDTRASEPAAEPDQTTAAAVREAAARLESQSAQDAEGDAGEAWVPSSSSSSSLVVSPPYPAAPLEERGEGPVAVVRRAAATPVPLRFAGAVVALAVAAGLLASSFGGSDRGPVASAGRVSLPVPAGWRSADGASPIRGLRLRDSVGLVDRADPSSRLVAGLVAGGAELPQQVARRLSAGTPDRVRLGSFEAYRYRLPASGRTLRLYLAPATGGLVAAVCSDGGAAWSFLQRCERAAASLSVADSTRYSLAGLDRYVARLDGVVRTLNARRAAGRERLRLASGPAAQARAAEQLAGAHASAARDLSRARVPAPAEAVNGRIVASLGKVATAYRRLARAARAVKGSRYGQARREVVRTESALQQALRSG